MGKWLKGWRVGWCYTVQKAPVLKHYFISFVSLVLGLAGSAQAQLPAKTPEQVTLNIIQTEEAVFPLSLVNTAVMSGTVTVAIDVDQKGQLSDCLVTSYSRKEFADSAVSALRRWRYEPPHLQGEPWASVQEIHFDYSRTGVVVSFTGLEAWTARLEELTKGRFAYRTYFLRELDRIPTPIQVVSPAAGPNEAKRTVTVEFYIDEEGRVRLPSVAQEAARDAYAANAIAAVRQWRFEPPLHKGRPVLVIVQQQFNFVPKVEAGRQK